MSDSYEICYCCFIKNIPEYLEMDEGKYPRAYTVWEMNDYSKSLHYRCGCGHHATLEVEWGYTSVLYESLRERGLKLIFENRTAKKQRKEFLEEQSKE
jgi:hypothetical protein